MGRASFGLSLAFPFVFHVMVPAISFLLGVFDPFQSKLGLCGEGVDIRKDLDDSHAPLNDCEALWGKRKSSNGWKYDSCNDPEMDARIIGGRECIRWFEAPQLPQHNTREAPQLCGLMPQPMVTILGALENNLFLCSFVTHFGLGSCGSDLGLLLLFFPL